MAQNNRVKAIALTVLLAAAQANAAPPKPRPAQMTGTQLVSDMLADPFADKVNPVRRERAMGYIDGVMDSTIGIRWCPSGRPVPHELNYVVAEDMAGMPQAKLNSNAAVLVLAILERHYPCKSAGATQ